MCNSRAAGLALLLAAVSMLPTAAHAAPPIKFVDDHGVVHYGDRASAEALVRANMGRESKPVASPPTAVKSNEGVLSAAEQQRKDRVLLDSYSSASEIDRARERVTSSLQAEIDLARRNVEKLKIRRNELDSARPGAPASAASAAQSVQVNELLTQELRFIALKTDQLEKASARYDADKRRWQEINGEVASR